MNLPCLLRKQPLLLYLSVLSCIFCSLNQSFAQQAPNISYPSPNILKLNAPIAISPSNTGGAVLAFTYREVSTNANNANIFGFKDEYWEKAISDNIRDYNKNENKSENSAFSVAPSSDATLANLNTNVGLSPNEFSPTNFVYKIRVPNDTASITIIALANDTNARITINNESLDPVSNSHEFLLPNTSNLFNIVVTAQDGVTQQTYTLKVIRSPSSIATLNNLSISTGKLNPLFNSNITTYVDNVPNATNVIWVIPETTNANATFTINGIKVNVDAGLISQPISLNVGTNILNIIVTAQDGYTQQTYTLKVIRAASSIATLSKLTVSTGSYSPTFDGDSTNYVENVPNGTNVISITPVTTDVNATVEVNGTMITSGMASQPIALNVGINIINVKVIAQDNATTQSYFLTINRAPSPIATLNDLVLSGGVLTPHFDQNNLTYTATLINNLIDSVIFTPFATQLNETINFNNQIIASGIPTSQLPVNIGTNTYVFSVTAQDGVTKNNYTTTIKKQPMLDNLVLTGDSYTQVLSIKNNVYIDSVSNFTTTIFLTPYFKDAICTLNGSIINTGNKSIPIQLNIGNNNITITLLSMDGTMNTIYTATIYRPPSNVATLSSYSVSEGSLSPTFDSNVLNYSTTLPYETTSITVNPTASQQDAKITVNNNVVNSGSSSTAIPLTVGVNTITTLVTAQDGATQKTYILKVIRNLSSEASLNNLSVSTGTLSPSFNSDSTSYADNVPNATDVISVTAVTTNGNANITVNGTPVITGSASQPISLNVGTNIINVTVIAQDQVTKKQYNLTVNRAPSGTDILSNLILSSGTLSPSFDSSTTIYNAYVSNGTGSITISPFVNDANETVTLNGISTIPGLPSQPIALNIGNNNISIEVTAPNGITKKTYTLMVNRIPSTNAELSNLAVSNGLLTPKYNNSINNYTDNVQNINTAIRVTPTVADPGASVTVNGLPCVSGTLSQIIPLTVGNNKITIVVAAQDGITQQTYNLIINRAPSGITLLSNLAVNKGTLSPLFDSGILLYTDNVTNNTSGIIITPTTNDSTATVAVSLNGNPVGSANILAGATEETKIPPSNYTIPLVVGNNTITAVVTAQNGTDQQTYTLKVNRAALGSAVLFNLIASGGGIWSQSFDPNIFNYTYMVSSTVNNIMLTPTLSDSVATVTINGKTVNTETASEPILLTVGKNVITIVVTAQDKTTAQTYTLLVDRAPSPIATLSNLVLSGGMLTPLFDPKKSSYNATLLNNLIDSVTFTPIATQTNEAIKLKNQVITNGLPTENIPVNIGTNIYAFTITAQDGVTKNSYTTIIKRQPIMDNLALTYGSFTQFLSSKNNSYIDSVSNLITTVNLTPFFRDAICTLNGSGINTGNASPPIQLNVGNNTITITLTSKDGTMNTAYTATIYRAPSDVATLSSFSISAGLLTPIFNSNVLNYSSIVPYETTSVTISPTASQQEAKILVNGYSVNSGSQSGVIQLALGPNTIITQVTAQNGKTNNLYTVTVIRDRGKQTFKFKPIATISYGSKDFSPGATVSSGLDITYTSSDTSVAVILNKKIIHVKGVGNTNIIARVAIDNNYYPVDSISQILTVIKGTQTIINNEIPVLIKGQPYDLKKIISSDLGLEVKFYVEDKAMADTANGVITPLQIGKTTLVAVADSNQYYATQTKTFEITIEDQANDEIVVHQFVTPNGDGFNDFLLIEGLQLFKDNTVKIINRNGILVYKAVGYDNENIKFDGHSSSNQDFLPAGTYFYIIDYTNSAGALRHKSDYITLKY